MLLLQIAHNWARFSGTVRGVKSVWQQRLIEILLQRRGTLTEVAYARFLGLSRANYQRIVRGGQSIKYHHVERVLHRLATAHPDRLAVVRNLSAGFPTDFPAQPSSLAVIPNRSSSQPSRLDVLPEQSSAQPDGLDVIASRFPSQPGLLAVVPNHFPVVPNRPATQPDRLAVTPKRPKSLERS